MIKLTLAYLLGSFALFLAGFFCHALFSSKRIKKESNRADFFEHKWNELMEITSARTDQMKDKDRP